VCTTDYATVIKFIINYAATARLHFSMADFVKGVSEVVGRALARAFFLNKGSIHVE